MDEQLDLTLAALADPVRRRIVGILVKQPVRAGDLASECAVSPQIMSRHLRQLRKSGIVAETTVENDARIRLYCLKPEALSGLRNWLDQLETFWNQQLAAFKDHIEKDQGINH